MLIHYLVLLITNTCAKNWRYRERKVLVLALEEAFSLEEIISMQGRLIATPRGQEVNTVGAQVSEEGKAKAADPSSITLVQAAY